MKPEDWARVRQVFEDAIELDPSERSAFLDEACAGSPAMRAEVVSLIHGHGDADSFFEAPVYEDLMIEQERRAISERGPGDIATLLKSGDTWKIE